MLLPNSRGLRERRKRVGALCAKLGLEPVRWQRPEIPDDPAGLQSTAQVAFPQHPPWSIITVDQVFSLEARDRRLLDVFDTHLNADGQPRRPTPFLALASMPYLMIPT
jgi:hypothetical protein